MEWGSCKCSVKGSFNRVLVWDTMRAYYAGYPKPDIMLPIRPYVATLKVSACRPIPGQKELLWEGPRV